MLDLPVQTLAEPDIEEEIDVDEDTALEPPFKVLIHNDDVTTFDFVIRILQTIFDHQALTAELIAWRTHTQGIAYVGTYPKSDAETRVHKAHFAAQLEGFPLRLTIEPEEI
jgi:ATP-dependent Clp protease adaptor protein ClpS